MLAEKKTATNVGVGLGIGLEIVGIVLALSGRPLLTLLALPVALASIGFFAWGCWSYAAGKGYPGVLGLLGVFFGFIGLLILILLPDKYKDGRLPATMAAYETTPYSALPMAPTYGAHTASSPAFAGVGAESSGAVFGAPGFVSPGNGNGGSAANRPPMGGDGAAGWDEGTAKFLVPQSVLAPQTVAEAQSVPATQSLPADASTPTSEGPVDGDAFQPVAPNYGERFERDMRPPTPAPNHWSVRQPA